MELSTIDLNINKDEINIKKEEEINEKNSKRLTKTEIFKNLFIEWAKSSTSHGLPNIFRTNKIHLKILWTIFFICSSGVCIFLVYQTFSDFFEYDVVTKIRIIDEKPIEYPAITICNLEPFVTQNGSEFILDYLRKKYNRKLTNINDILFNPYLFKDNISKEYEYLNKFVSNPDFDNEKRKQFGYNKTTFIQFCSFNNELCNYNEIEWLFYPTLGNCFKFNSAKAENGSEIDIKKSFNVGYEKGYRIELFTGSDKTNYLNPFLRSKGIRLFIHNQSVLPSYTEGVNIETGKCINIVFKKIITSSIPSPYSNCQDTDNFKSYLFDFIKYSNYTYRQEDCLDLCYQNFIIDNCGCFDTYYKKIFDVKPCLTDEDLNCLIDNFNKFIQNDDNNENCLKQCPLECESITYDLDMSYSTYPTVAYLAFLKKFKYLEDYFNKNKNYTLDDIKDSMVCLYIYNNDFKYTSISESKKTSELDLVGLVGGTLGLFIGISLLSLIEIVAMLLEAVYLISIRDAKKMEDVIF